MLCGFEGPGGPASAAQAPDGLEQFPVALAWGKHLFPFRTEQLSPTAPMVLGLRGPGRVGRRRFFVSRTSRPRGRLVFVKRPVARAAPRCRRRDRPVGTLGAGPPAVRRVARRPHLAPRLPPVDPPHHVVLVLGSDLGLSVGVGRVSFLSVPPCALRGTFSRLCGSNVPLIALCGSRGTKCRFSPAVRAHPYPAVVRLCGTQGRLAARRLGGGRSIGSRRGTQSVRARGGVGQRARAALRRPACSGALQVAALPARPSSQTGHRGADRSGPLAPGERRSADLGTLADRPRSARARVTIETSAMRVLVRGGGSLRPGGRPGRVCLAQRGELERRIHGAPHQLAKRALGSATVDRRGEHVFEKLRIGSDGTAVLQGFLQGPAATPHDAWPDRKVVHDAPR